MMYISFRYFLHVYFATLVRQLYLGMCYLAILLQFGMLNILGIRKISTKFYAALTRGVFDSKEFSKILVGKKMERENLGQPFEFVAKVEIPKISKISCSILKDLFAKSPTGLKKFTAI